MSIELHTVDNGNVQAINDGRLYSQLTGAVGGIVVGADCASSGGLVVSVTSGWGIASGRVFTITAENYTVVPSPSGARKGRLYVKIDLTDASEPIKVLSITGASLPALVQQDLSNGGTVYEIELAHYDITTLAISNLVSNSKIIITPVPKSGGAFSGNITAPNIGAVSEYHAEEETAHFIGNFVAGTISLPAGVWVINGKVRFETGSAGRKMLQLGTEQYVDTHANYVNSIIANGENLALEVTGIFTLANTTTIVLTAWSKLDDTMTSRYINAVRIK